MITCEVCGEKPAKIHVTKIENGKKMTIHMCQDCARKQAAESAQSKFSLSGLLGGFLAQEGGEPTPKEEEMLTCSGCGQTYRAFKESGKLGCSECYDTFEKQLMPLLKKIQKGDHHIGKRPSSGVEPTPEEQLRESRREMQRAIANEEFERAATLRDEIRRLENQIES